jgi:hypothetical protein
MCHLRREALSAVVPTRGNLWSVACPSPVVARHLRGRSLHMQAPKSPLGMASDRTTEPAHADGLSNEPSRNAQA